MVKRLLLYMQTRESAAIDELYEHVWCRSRVSNAAIKTAISKANHFLAKQGHPSSLSKRESAVRWA
jgi:hypothetical protein